MSAAEDAAMKEGAAVEAAAAAADSERKQPAESASDEGGASAPEEARASGKRRAWLRLAERVFAHPRYAMLVLAALAACALWRTPWVLGPVALFFMLEWTARFWFQRASDWPNPSERIYLALDALATASLVAVLFMPDAGGASYGFWLRLARLLRGLYLLRMLRIFRFLSFDTFVWSTPLALASLGLAGLGLAVDGFGLYAGVALLLETGWRLVAIRRVLPQGARRHAETGFVALDALAALALTGLIPGVSPWWALLRLARFFIMLNPLGKVARAFGAVLAKPEIRGEAGMLLGMLGAMLLAGVLAVYFLYPQMDLNEDDAANAEDYALVQVLLFVFRLLMDPGAAPPVAFSPGLAAMTVALVLAGVFLFALVVGLGANMMEMLLRELANSPLSPRESLMFVGINRRASAVLRQFDRIGARMRRVFPAVWLFFGEPAPEARTAGRWLSVRSLPPGGRGASERFGVSGVRRLIVFQGGDWGDMAEGGGALADLHHLARDIGAPGLVVAEREPPERIRRLFDESLGMGLVNSSGVAARMLYQMHHCGHMPELGMRLLDAVEGEAGLFACPWAFEVRPEGGVGRMREAGDGEWVPVEAWLRGCFARGVNPLAAMDAEGRPVLFVDLAKGKAVGSFSDVIAVGRQAGGWPALMRAALAEKAGERAGDGALRAFQWPDNWDLNLMFLGWHEGLPAMAAEMALKHHKIDLHVFSTADEETLAGRLARLRAVAREAEAHGCAMAAHVHAWDGLDAAPLLEQMRGCKVVMLYPEDADGREDSTLELWFHELARTLAARKAKAKWWTPPKLMVLPRAGDQVQAFMRAAQGWPELEVHVGSPDAFHDVFIARRLLNEALRPVEPEIAARDDRVFAFMEAMLGDAVLVESVAAERLLPEGEAPDWAAIHAEALRRGWLLLGYTLPPAAHDRLHALIERLFPDDRAVMGGSLREGPQLLGGAPPASMDEAIECAELIFCRRGVLKTDAVSADESEEAVVSAEAAPDEMAGNLQAVEAPAPAEQAADAGEGGGEESRAVVPAGSEVKEGEIMQESVWPAAADKRLLRILERQVAESLALLESSAEEGLVKLSAALDAGPSGEVEEAIMGALTDLQNIDRVMQRLNNVRSCLADWAATAPAPEAPPLWREEVEKRYVMEEERHVLKEEL